MVLSSTGEILGPCDTLFELTATPVGMPVVEVRNLTWVFSVQTDISAHQAARDKLRDELDAAVGLCAGDTHCLLGMGLLQALSGLSAPAPEEVRIVCSVAWDAPGLAGRTSESLMFAVETGARRAQATKWMPRVMIGDSVAFSAPYGRVEVATVVLPVHDACVSAAGADKVDVWGVGEGALQFLWEALTPLAQAHGLSFDSAAQNLVIEASTNRGLRRGHEYPFSVTVVSQPPASSSRPVAQHKLHVLVSVLAQSLPIVAAINGGATNLTGFAGKALPLSAAGSSDFQLLAGGLAGPLLYEWTVEGGSCTFQGPVDRETATLLPAGEEGDPCFVQLRLADDDAKKPPRFGPPRQSVATTKVIVECVV